MSMERGDSPLAGRRPAPLQSLSAMGMPSAPLSALHSPPSATTLQGLPLPPLGGLGASLPGAPLRSPPLHSAPLSGTVSGTGANFWRELKDVEAWYDRLDPSERTAVLNSLVHRSSHGELKQLLPQVERQLQEPEADSDDKTAPPSSAQASKSKVGFFRPPMSAGATSSSITPSSITPGTISSGGMAGMAAMSGRINQLGKGARGRAPLSSSAPFEEESEKYAHVFPKLGYSPWDASRPASSSEWPEESDGSPGLKTWRTYTPAGAGAGQAPERSLLCSYRLYGSSMQLANNATSSNGFSRSYSAPSSAVYPYFPRRDDANAKVPPVGMSASASSSNLSTLANANAGASANANGVSAGASTSANGANSSASANANANANANVSGQNTQNTNVNPPGAQATSAQSSAPGGTSNAQSSAQSSASTGSTVNGAQSVGANGQSRTGGRRRNVNVVDLELLSDIGAWLRTMRLHKYTGNLSGMTWQEVIKLTDADLEERGVGALGARRKLLKMFQEIRQAQEDGLLSK